MADPQTWEIGYLDLVDLGGEDGFRAGLLVVDVRGYPKEFYCTSKVNPSFTQRLIYGASLLPYLMCEVLARPLLDRLKVQPRAILTRDWQFLDLRKLQVECPVAAIADKFQGKPSWVISDIWEGESARLEICVHRDFPEDAEAVEQVLDELQCHIPVLEPFERIERAVNAVDKQQRDR